GGGLSSVNDLTLTDCVVSGNTAATFGGGIDNPLTATLTNVTVSGNTSAERGGGIANDLLDAIATLTNVTIADNSASPGNGGGFELGAAPPCPAGANFPSIDCRLDELIQTVQTVVPAGALRDGLGRILTSAKVQTGQAEQALANGKRRREKSMLGRANGSLGKFSARLRTRKAQKQIPGVALTGMKTAAG